MKKRKLFLLKKNKDSFLALNYLITIILSVIALFFIIKIFAATFLIDSSNLSVAKGNAQSIVEFVNSISEKNSYDKYDCFYILKLKNIENFQYYTKDLEDNYFFVISEEKVHILPLIDYQDFVKNKNRNPKNYEVKSFEFKNSIDLKRDITKGNSIQVDVDFEFWTLSTLGGSGSNKLKLDNFDKKTREYIILFPYLSEIKGLDISVDTIEKQLFEIGKTASKGLIPWLESYQNQNVFFLELIQEATKSTTNPGMVPKSFKTREITKKLGSFYLSLDNNDNLFAVKDQYSEILVRKNLCNFYKLRDKDEYNFYNPTDADGNIIYNLRNKRLNNAITKKIVYYWPEEDNFDYKFIWKNKNYFCEINGKNQCPNNFDDKIKNFEDFEKKIISFLSSKEDDFESGDLNFNLYDMKIEETEEIELDFNVYFNVLDEDISKIKDRKKNNIFNIDDKWIGKNTINGVNKESSNLIQIKDLSVYSFYKQEDNNNLYYSFNPINLRTKNNENNELEIYFNSNKINYEKKSADKADSGFLFWKEILGDNEDIYFLEIPFLNKETHKKEFYDVFLTKTQLFDIKEEVKNVQ